MFLGIKGTLAAIYILLIMRIRYWTKLAFCLALLGFVGASSLMGQSDTIPSSFSRRPFFDFQTTLGFGTDAKLFVPSFQGEGIVSFPIHPNFSIEGIFGGRLNLMHVDQKVFQTSFPNRPGEGVFDTLQVKDVRVFSLNLHVGLALRFWEKWSVGTDIDLVGWSFGSRGLFLYESEGSTESQSFQWASPEPFNVMLMGRNDRGSLNSRFWLGYRFHKKWEIQGGLAIVHIIYRTDNTLAFENDRFFSDYKAGFVSVAYRPFN